MHLDGQARLMALGCWKRGLHTGRWCRVHLNLRESDLTYTEGVGGRTRKPQLESKHESPRVQFSSIEQVSVLGVTASSSCFAGPPRWQWAVLLNDAGRESCGAGALYFQCETQQVP